MHRAFDRFLGDDASAAAVEYGPIAALVSTAAVVALQTLGGRLAELFAMVSETLQSAVTASLP